VEVAVDLITLSEQPQTPSKPVSQMLERVASLFMRKRGMWIDSSELAQVGGRCAWRTRTSECRTILGMDIRNRQRRVKQPDGSQFTVSEYGYKVEG
jgi:hypothetical protein